MKMYEMEIKSNEEGFIEIHQPSMNGTEETDVIIISIHQADAACAGILEEKKRIESGEVVD